MAEATRVESITASSAIEGVVVDAGRIQGLVAEGTEPRHFRNRNEREFAGYRDAMDEISRATELEAFSVPHVLHLHRLLFGHTAGGGGRLKTEQNLIVSSDRGHREVLFTPPSPKETEFLLPYLFDRYRQAVADQAAHPILLIGALVLDFLAIHPVADGNGRLARLITTHALLQQGYAVSRYVSIEQRMLATKDAYYDAIHASQRRWHEGEHDVWPWIGYLVDVLATAYAEFEGRVVARRNLATGSKQDQVRRYILHHAPAVFRFRDVREALPGIGDPTIKRVPADLRREGAIEAADVRASDRLSAWKRRSQVVETVGALSLRSHRPIVERGLDLLGGTRYCYLPMSVSTAAAVKRKVARAKPGTFLRVSDLAKEASSRHAVEHALSRLAASDSPIVRAHKGLYFRGFESRFGKTRPRPLAVALELARDRGAGPAGWTALRALGVTTQMPSVDELAIVGGPPTGIKGVRFHVRRNPDRLSLTFHEIAALEALRVWGTHGDRELNELGAAIRKLAAEGRIRPNRLTKAASREPARVRGLLSSVLTPGAA